MAESKERRKAPRKPAAKPDVKAAYEPEDMRRQIEEAAYYRAKQRGFEPGHELEDWVQAESEVMQRNASR
jgi:hypothetical protein